jgi:hypothetical protein
MYKSSLQPDKASCENSSNKATVTCTSGTLSSDDPDFDGSSGAPVCYASTCPAINLVRLGGACGKYNGGGGRFRANCTGIVDVNPTGGSSGIFTIFVADPSGVPFYEGGPEPYPVGMSGSYYSWEGNDPTLGGVGGYSLPYGSGSFAVGTPTFASQLAMGDVNGDGIQDVFKFYDPTPGTFNGYVAQMAVYDGSSGTLIRTLAAPPGWDGYLPRATISISGVANAVLHGTDSMTSDDMLYFVRGDGSGYTSLDCDTGLPSMTNCDTIVKTDGTNLYATVTGYPSTPSGWGTLIKFDSLGNVIYSIITPSETAINFAMNGTYIYVYGGGGAAYSGGYLGNLSIYNAATGDTICNTAFAADSNTIDGYTGTFLSGNFDMNILP